jgi:hypothetical protein
MEEFCQSHWEAFGGNGNIFCWCIGLHLGKTSGLMRTEHGFLWFAFPGHGKAADKEEEEEEEEEAFARGPLEEVGSLEGGFIRSPPPSSNWDDPCSSQKFLLFQKGREGLKRRVEGEEKPIMEKSRPASPPSSFHSIPSQN